MGNKAEEKRFEKQPNKPLNYRDIFKLLAIFT
jgi:hypothetical protein